MRLIIRRVFPAVATLCLLASGTGVSAAAPALEPRPSVQTVEEALTCTGDPRTGPTPLLLLHGTTSTAVANWSWNWDRYLDARGWAHCDLQSPDNANGDIQLSGEYVARAITIMFERAGRPISILGHSQGGMVARWAFAFWPETRAMVDDYVGLASSNHGSRNPVQDCHRTRECSAARWQQTAGSAFLSALNRQPETFPQIDYTVITTQLDEIVVPYTSSYLPTGPNVTNVSVQNLCPGRLVEHFGMAYDNTAFELALDALTHNGTARPERVGAAGCGAMLMPGVDPAGFVQNSAMALNVSVQSTLSAPRLSEEPPVMPYAR
ncbi:esterase/lipase family protein [Nocardia cyriacigeorgica]|uniref:esterase/lipase family protein n=1 Tax=Nocardia cyriacigeorgica TaxID=135487 RepID=UPI0018942923|nr:lipase [Nocardia cyriacigeorgica]MBF6455326.1 lipase [Nocardia cyriacigeorgica]MBF6480867.1 lipase [Nocardia cyriacigeorgica]MBF6553932.1 lipase [Nocardia cyriacigeorgica]